MRFRPGPLKAAAALAAGFVAVRVVYRVLFHGADGAGAVLLDLPVYRLAPPFAHVELLGPVTTGGLWDAAAGAAAIAATILVFGVLNALLDLPRLLARGARTGPFQGIARALSVAWATLPALVDGVRAVRFAHRLRGERPGVRLLSPVLERTLERASSVAAALELRGYAGRGLGGDCAHPVELRAVSAGFGAGPVVRADELSLSHGELVILAGPTGAGKSTLLRALSGLHTHLDGGTLVGDVRVVGHDRVATAPRDTARTVGVVLQQPRSAFATERVDDEVGLALELRGVASVIRASRVREVAERVGITSLLGRELRGLSAGEATLVAIAAAIIEQPILLLVDEPLADLDVAARTRIIALLEALAHDAGMCVVIAEHRVAELAGVADRVLVIDDGQVRDVAWVPEPATDGEEISAAEEIHAASPLRRANLLPSAAARAGGMPGRHDQGTPGRMPVLTATDVTVDRGDRRAVDQASLHLDVGEIVALTGPNGAGKSTLLVALATAVNGVQAAGPVALVPDTSDDLFLRDTVAAECRLADRRGGAPLTDGTSAARFAALLGLGASDPAFARRLAQHPRDLSAGERRCLAIVLQTARAPSVLLVDEPTRGLDPSARALVARTLVAQADAGAAVLLATHDVAFAAALASRTLAMRGGILSNRTSDSALAAATGAAPAGVTSARGTSTPASSEPARHDLPRASERDVEGSDRPAVDRASGDPEHTRTRAPRAARGRFPWRRTALVAANLAAAGAFLWPLVASAVPAQAQASVPYIALGLAPLAVLLVLGALDSSIRSAHTLALLAVLAAIGAAIRIVGTGVGGVEALFVLLILAGRAFGPRFGLLLGASAIALSAVMWGGVGPWLPFQMFACGWVAAGAGLLPRRVRGWGEIGMLCGYGILSSYLFGLIMNMWFWPFAVGGGTGISYVPDGSLGENLASFLVYSLVTSTLTWDTLRAVTTVVGLVLVGRAILASLRRAKPVAAHVPAPRPIVLTR